jgi:catechol 2,3-dioxygenase-like lactoylglutathione lyase family enzyme
MRAAGNEIGAPPQLRRLVRITLITAALARLTDFYLEAFGCTLLGIDDWHGAEREAETEIAGGARRALLGLGAERIELLQFDRPGAAYPPALAASDRRFQHCALVVTDIEAAFQQLSRSSGWSAISSAGPQRLPDNSGGVSAFKFRDPEGHPLELLAFAPERLPRKWRDRAAQGLFLGLDHSAISVADSARSIAFYESLGLELLDGSHNRGPEQARLDGLAAPDVEVSALGLPEGGAHLELLCYRGAAPDGAVAGAHDIAATRLVFDAAAAADAPGRCLRDPDGHRLVLL